jgi:hypothetical protein
MSFFIILRECRMRLAGRARLEVTDALLRAFQALARQGLGGFLPQYFLVTRKLGNEYPAAVCHVIRPLEWVSHL